eukprot:GGOE01018811.1.p1 GENE.GGOE01018811.1~~GGOE01018811.1.p1  ORF type:complete len:299 (+),score=75.84 GGOE01018811.1:53-898(+)
MAQTVFRCQLGDAMVLKRLIQAVREIVVEANFDCTPRGVQVQAMDTTHHCLMVLNLEPGGFRRFECSVYLSLGLHIEHLRKLLEPITPGCSATLSVHEPRERLDICIESSEGGPPVVEWTLHLIDIDAEHMSLPDDEEAQGKAIFSMASDELFRICSAFTELADAVTLELSTRSVVFIPDIATVDPERDVMSGGSSGSITIALRPGSRAGVDPGAARLEGTATFEPIRQTFRLPFLLAISRSRTVSSRVHLQLTPQAPLLVMYPLGPLGCLRYYVAGSTPE